jgi:hypothetical protein
MPKETAKVVRDWRAFSTQEVERRSMSYRDRIYDRILIRESQLD